MTPSNYTEYQETLVVKNKSVHVTTADLKIESMTSESFGQYLCMTYSKGGRAGKLVTIIEKKCKYTILF